MNDAEPVGLLRGRGAALGPLALQYPATEKSLLRVIRAQAQARPDHPWLVVDGTDVLTYAEAERQVNQVADAVLAAVGAGAHVAVMLRNQVEFLPAFYGAQAAGGVSVPLNPDARGPLLRYVVDHADARLLIVRADLLPVFEGLEDLAGVELVVAVGAPEHDVPDAVHGVPVTRWDAWLGGRSTAPQPDIPPADRMCLLQFTSGTTGRPKGAIYSHHFLHLFAALMADNQEFTAGDQLFTPLPVCHVAALHLVANAALVAGCTSHLRSRFSATAYWDQAAECGATWSIILGPMASIVLKSVEQAPPHRVRSMYCVPVPHDRGEFEQRYGVTMYSQGFGMTEIFPCPPTTKPFPDQPDDSLGMPMDWMEYGVVDEHDNLLPPDTVGDLVFRPLLPYGMVSGYYKAEEQTVAAFRNFMFHTGDLATYDAEGILHFRGRRTERIRRRGENVSALELEFVALQHPAILEAAAYGVPSPLGEEDVKLDVVLKEELALEDYHAWLAANLPRYMVPRYLERRKAFPKTLSERIQKVELAKEPLDRPGVLDFAGEREQAAGRR